MGSPHGCIAVVLVVVVAAACAAGGTPSSALEPSALDTFPPQAETEAPSQGQTPSPTPGLTSTATATATTTATLRAIDLAAIVAVPTAHRLEVFGAEPMHLGGVWSPVDLGLGGICADASAPTAWLECGNADWMVIPSAAWRGPVLEVFFEPGLRERLGRDLQPGDGPLDLVGQFGDPAAEQCAPAEVEACRDRFVVTSIDGR